MNQLLNRGKKSSSPDLQVFSFAVMKEATNEFSMNNRVGEGGYGPVYKVIHTNYNSQVCLKQLPCY